MAFLALGKAQVSHGKNRKARACEGLFKTWKKPFHPGRRRVAGGMNTPGPRAA
jgi:hypothetical protein